jgi:hypothetical protein
VDLHVMFISTERRKGTVATIISASLSKKISGMPPCFRHSDIYCYSPKNTVLNVVLHKVSMTLAQYVCSLQ